MKSFNIMFDGVVMVSEPQMQKPGLLVFWVGYMVTAGLQMRSTASQVILVFLKGAFCDCSLAGNVLKGNVLIALVA